MIRAQLVWHFLQSLCIIILFLPYAVSCSHIYVEPDRILCISRIYRRVRAVCACVRARVRVCQCAVYVRVPSIQCFSLLSMKVERANSDEPLVFVNCIAKWTNCCTRSLSRQVIELSSLSSTNACARKGSIISLNRFSVVTKKKAFETSDSIIFFLSYHVRNAMLVELTLYEWRLRACLSINGNERQRNFARDLSWDGHTLHRLVVNLLFYAVSLTLKYFMTQGVQCQFYLTPFKGKLKLLWRCILWVKIKTNIHFAVFVCSFVLYLIMI